MSEIELILTKLKIVSEEKENGMYLCDRKHSKTLLDYIQQKENIIKEAIEYHDNCVNNLLDLDKIDENERLAYKVAYEIHDNYLKILKEKNNE